MEIHKLIKRNYAFYQMLTSTRFEVIKLLNEVSFVEWWKHTRFFSLDDLQRFEDMLSIISGQQNQSLENVDISTSYIEEFAENNDMQSMLIQEHKDLSDEDFVKDEITPFLGRGLLESCKENINIKAYRIIAWLCYKNVIGTAYRYAKISFPRKSTSKFSPNLLKMIMQILDKIVQKYPITQVIKQVVAYKNIADDILELQENRDVNFALEIAEKYNKQYVYDTEKDLAFLFVLLNTLLIPYQTQLKIVDYLKQTPFNYEIQKRYDVFANKIPEVTDWVFCRNKYKKGKTMLASRTSVYASDTSYASKDNVPIIECADASMIERNCKRTILGESEFILKMIPKKEDKEVRYREIVEAIYDEYAVSSERPENYFVCSKIDFVYLLGCVLKNDEIISRNPVIDWVETQHSLLGFMYALYYGEAKVNKDGKFVKEMKLIIPIGKGDKKNCYSFKGKDIKISNNKKEALQRHMVWQKQIKAIASRVLYCRR